MSPELLKIIHANQSDIEKEQALRTWLKGQLMNYEMVSNYLKKSRTTIRKYIQEKRFKPIVSKPQFQVFLKTDIDAYLNKQDKT